MGWFDEQIRQRMKADNDTFSDAFASMAAVVMGPRAKAFTIDDQQRTKNAVNELLAFHHVKFAELPDELTELDQQLDYLLRSSGVMRRNVILEGSWYKDAIGAFLGVLKTGGVVALLPNKLAEYTFFDYESGKTLKLNQQTAALLKPEAICFYKPLPLKKLGIRDLLAYIADILAPVDFFIVGFVFLCVALMDMLLPKLNNILFSNVIENGDFRLLLAVAVMMVTTGISIRLVNTVKSIVLDRIKTKTDVAVQAATMMRVLSLPAQFFKKYSAGELSKRTQSVSSLCQTLCDIVIIVGLNVAFSFLYLPQVYYYAPVLAMPSLILVLTLTLWTILSSFMQTKISNQLSAVSSKELGLLYALISGIQKIKLSGAEKRVFSRWGRLYEQKAHFTYDAPLLLKLNAVVSTGILLVGTIVLYYIAATSGVSIADYLAFNSAYGMLSGAFLTLAGVALKVASVKSTFEMVRPILEGVPEVDDGKKVLAHFAGGIELSNLSFRYADTAPLIVDQLSLKIRPGQYVAIVGKTGCGKSTLLRLLLGFEAPQKGTIYYDGEDISTLDLKSLRQHIGSVTQNGKLFTGDILSNITISSPQLSLDDAWKVAEQVGLAQDIRNMPMGMHTIISEGGGGISGGQKQRLMIARAIAAKPQILILDEATSALDNLSQKAIVASLESLKCTRIVIAHRLSTILQCDRILVLDQGRIVEDGSYQQLIQKGGYFAELVARQRLDDI